MNNESLKFFRSFLYFALANGGMEVESDGRQVRQGTERRRRVETQELDVIASCIDVELRIHYFTDPRLLLELFDLATLFHGTG